MKFLIFVVALYAAHCVSADQIEVKVCNSAVTNQYVDKIDLAIDPNPIEIKPGKTISIHFGVDVLKDIAVGSSIDLSLHYGILNLPIPCLDVSRIIK